jgi:hypothetical protein
MATVGEVKAAVILVLKHCRDNGVMKVEREKSDRIAGTRGRARCDLQSHYIGGKDKSGFY